jgi:hypothetical protein
MFVSDILDKIERHVDPIGGWCLHIFCCGWMIDCCGFIRPRGPLCPSDEAFEDYISPEGFECTRLTEEWIAKNKKRYARLNRKFGYQK